MAVGVRRSAEREAIRLGRGPSIAVQSRSCCSEAHGHVTAGMATNLEQGVGEGDWGPPDGAACCRHLTAATLHV